MSLEEKIQQLLDEGKGDIGRLNHILTKVKNGKHLWDSDQNYLDALLEESDSTENYEIVEEPKTEESIPQEQEYQDEGHEQHSLEIDQLRNEVHKLQDQNHLIEKHLRKQGGKSGSMARAFGRGVGGVSLFLFGLGMIFLLYYHLTNLDNSMRGYYGDPMGIMIIVLVVVPAILLSLGGSSIYYGIRIISRT